MIGDGLRFNPPPGWPQPPEGWVPPKDWTPDPEWPEPPPDWQLWLPIDANGGEGDDSAASKSGESSGSGVGVNAGDEHRVSFLEAEVATLRAQLEAQNAGEDLVILDDERILQDVGIYRYHHPLENAESYKERLKELGVQIATLVKTKQAIVMSNMFTFDNSLAKGRKMSNDLGKLMLRAYNAESDNGIRSLRAGNVVTAKKRLEASRSAIKKLGSMMEMQISDEFHSMRLQEIELTADYLIKKQEEREEAREERARIREEKKVEAELAAQREKLDKEKAHILNAIKALSESGERDKALEDRLAKIDGAIEENDFRKANIKAGYVYIISNRGAFGENVVKIGLTRRLDPTDRVRELSGASVPFKFDVHAIFFSEDAVQLESELHQHFSDRRVNCANARKEFFFASPGEVRDVLASKVGNLLEFTEKADSTEFLQSLHHWPDSAMRPRRD